MSSKIVSGAIGPIHAHKLRLKSLLLQDAATPRNPITQQMYERLPRMTPTELGELRAYLVARDPNEPNGMCDQDDVDSWVAMVDAEIRCRHSDSLSALLKLLSGK